jgi:purine-nucleoside phosphorylase
MRSSWNAYSTSEELRAIRGAAADAVILGSGLAGLADALDTLARIPYARIPGFGAPSVDGHPGFVSLNRIAGEPVLLLAGRFHAYEGTGAAGLASPVALAAYAGCARIVVTQAAGSLTRRISPGTWMLATDAVSFPARLVSGLNRAPYRNDDSRLERRGAASIVSERLSSALRDAARAARVPLADGVLCWTSGPTYETAAEARAAAIAGADAATMSSFPELLAAQSLRMEAACLSWITNYTAHISGGRTDHAHVVGMGERGAPMLGAILAALFRARRAE